MGLDDLEQLRGSMERIQELLEHLVVRGLLACGTDELAVLASYGEHLEQSGAGRLARELAELKKQIETGQRTSPRQLLATQTTLRLVSRLLTLHVVRGRYSAALAMAELEAAGELEAGMDAGAEDGTEDDASGDDEEE